MTIDQFVMVYATCFKDHNEKKYMLNPLNKFKIGSIISTIKNYEPIGGEYRLREHNNNVYITFLNDSASEYLVAPTDEGLKLQSTNNVMYLEFDPEEQEKCIIRQSKGLGDYFWSN